MCGFNTVRTSAPWNLHEPQAGRQNFSGSLDISEFLSMARAQGLHAIVRVGPVVGEPFSDGGLPAWTGELSQGRVRESDEAFLGAVSAWFHSLLSQLVRHQLAGSQSEAESGSLLAIELEQGWSSGDPDAAGPYFDHLIRLARESGILVPLLTNNGLWVQPSGTIEMWEGHDGLFAHGRQLRTVQPGAPGIVVVRERTEDSGGLLRRVALAAASGAQVIVGSSDDSHGPLYERESLLALRPLSHFLSSFGPSLVACEPSAQALALNPESAPPESTTLVPLSGSAGVVAWIFAPRSGVARSAVELVAPDGQCVRVPSDKSPVAWIPLGVDLHGRGKLDWSTLSPLAMVGKKMLVVSGPEGSSASISIDRAVVDLLVPAAGERPLIVTHQRLVLVVLNTAQARTALVVNGDLIVGAQSVSPTMAAVPAKGFKKAIRVSAAGALHELNTAPRPRGAVTKGAPRESAPKASATELRQLETGSHSRFALMKRAQTLAECGASGQAGWYRIAITQPRAGTRRLLWPNLGGRVSWWIDGAPLKGSQQRPMELKLSAGTHRLVALVEHVPPQVPGTAIIPSGFGSAPIEVAAPRRVKSRRMPPAPVDPFVLRKYLRGVRRSDLARQEACGWVLSDAGSTKPASDSRWLLDLSGTHTRGVVSVSGKAVALVEPSEPASTLVVLEPSVREVRFTPFAPTGGPPPDIDAIIAHAVWYQEAARTVASLAPIWAFARAD
jgi:hypothetical protein